MQDANKELSLEEKFLAVEAFLRAAGVPEQTVLRNMAEFRKQVQWMRSIVQPDPHESPEQYGARAALLARAIFADVPDTTGLVLQGKYAVLDLMRGTREHLFGLCGLLSPNDPATEDFARQCGLVSGEGAEE